jgi:glycosyltransferase involved in cell wall biosynthesis
MKRDLLLVFAYHFPPENAVGGARPYRFCKYLGKLGVRCRVFTAADVSARPDLDAETIPDPFVTAPRRGLGWQLERVVRRFFLPGVSGSQWGFRAAEAATRFLESEYASRDDVRVTVLSTYPPLGTPLAAYLLVKKHGFKWISDFRDPMASNPGSGDINDFHRFVYKQAEHLVINTADCVIANTDSAQQKLRSLYLNRSSRIQLIWNGFDPEQKLTALPVPKRERRVYSHVGELYEGRSIAALLYSMGRLIDNGRLDPEGIQIQQIGPVRAGCLPDPEFTANAELKGWLKVVPIQLAQAEAQKISRESDGLLLVQPHSTLQVPGKLFEYIQIGRPVLAFILPDSPIEQILMQSATPFQAVYASSAAETMDEAVAGFFALDTVAIAPNDWFINTFDGQKHAEQLYGLIQELHGSD